jgi:hypothetical protein
VSDLIISALACMLPAFCLLGLRSPFEMPRARNCLAAAISVGAIGGLVLIAQGESSVKLGIALLVPMFQFVGYYVLKRLIFGRYDWQPEFVLFDYRKDAGTWRDRLFLGTFVGLALFSAAAVIP